MTPTRSGDLGVHCVRAGVLAGLTVACGRGAPPSTSSFGPARAAEHEPMAAAPPSELAVAQAPLRSIGPFTIPMSGTRNVYVAVPPELGRHRVIANLHGLCNPPGYACGYWTEVASEHGFLVCPEGNTTCGAGGPPSWNESFGAMDQDLEKALNVVDAQYPDEITREGAILTGFSRGGWAVPAIAAMHKGRWPYLIINEADVTLSRASLEAAGVNAAVLMAGEWGSQLPGERQTVARLRKEGFRAELIVMPKAGHYYSANISELMRQAIAFLLETPEG